MNHRSADPRRSPRSKVLLAATLEFAGEALPVVLRDLSEHGALIETEAPLRVDAEVWFCRNELRVHGHVAWSHDNQAGIAFTCALKADVVLRYIKWRSPRAVEEPVHRRPALTRPGMSSEEQRWAEEIMRPPARDRRK